MKKPKSTNPPSEGYANFEKLAKALIALPSSELDKREAEPTNKESNEKRNAA